MNIDLRNGLIISLLLISTVQVTSSAIEKPKHGKILARLSFFDSPISQIYWCADNRSAIALTIFGSVYTTNTRGSIWSKFNKEFKDTARKQGIDTKGKTLYIIQNKAQKNHLVFVGKGKLSFVTKDCASHIEILRIGKGIRKVQFHPTDPEKLLALIVKIRKCLTPLCLPNSTLFYTKDSGKTWEKIKKHVIDFSWAYQTETANPSFPVNRIIALVQSDGGLVDIPQWTDKYSIYSTDNFFTQSKLIIKRGSRFALSKHFLYIAQVDEHDSREVQLWVTKSTDPDYKMIAVKLPFPLLRQVSFTVLDMSFRQTFIHVTHSHSGVSFGNIYKSDSSGSVFVLSARNNVKNDIGYCDFDMAKGLRGIYFINQYEEQEIERARIEIDIEEDPKKKAEVAKNVLKKRSKISFDRGGSWEYIRAPVKLQ